MFFFAFAEDAHCQSKIFSGIKMWNLDVHDVCLGPTDIWTPNAFVVSCGELVWGRPGAVCWWCIFLDRGHVWKLMACHARYVSWICPPVWINFVWWDWDGHVRWMYMGKVGTICNLCDGPPRATNLCGAMDSDDRLSFWSGCFCIVWPRYLDSIHGLEK